MKVVERPPIRNTLHPKNKGTINCLLCKKESQGLFCCNLCRWISEHCTILDDDLHSKDSIDRRWIKIGLNSSYKAMEEVALMFKG